MREVTGYYHMSAWRYERGPHRIKVIANERSHAAEAIKMFLDSHGYNGKSVEEIARVLRSSRTIASNITVIVADFYKEEIEDIEVEQHPLRAMDE